MDSRTAEIYNMDEMDLIAEAIERNRPFSDEEIVVLDKELSFDEVARRHAEFETWAEALGLQLHTRQLRRKAEKRYKKALKRGGYE